MPRHIKVAINLGLSHDLKPDAVPPGELAAAMDVELEAFDRWFRSQGNQPLARLERSILKTYLAWKLLHEEDDVDSTDGGRSDG